MRKILLSAVALLLLLSASAQTLSEREAARRRGRELYDFGRWSEARQAFTEAKRLIPERETAACEEIDYYLAALAVELGSD